MTLQNAAPIEVLERCRHGGQATAAEVRRFVSSWLAGGATDAQMAAWLMATALHGLDADGAKGLCAELIASGDRLDLADLGPVGDIACTGAVGDATVLVAAPLAACLGVHMAVSVDRGLGIVGGTADSLEAIPGYRTQPSLGEFVRQVRDVGCAVVAQAERIAPGERRLAVLRDQTATADGGAVAAASVMARALAGGASAVALHVAYGGAAVLPDAASAQAAVQLMRAVAAPWKRAVPAVTTHMDLPPGRMVGNALEVREAAEVLRGGGPPALRAIAVSLAAELAEALEVVPAEAGRERAGKALAQGDALGVAERWVEGQGGDPRVWSDDRVLPVAPVQFEVTATHDGPVRGPVGRALGEIVRRLGGGRLHPSQSIDHAVGVELLVDLGEPVTRGEPLARVHSRDRWLGERARDELAEALGVAEPAGADD